MTDPDLTREQIELCVLLLSEHLDKQVFCFEKIHIYVYDT